MFSVRRGIWNVTAGDRPNFLFIIVDDQSPLDLKPYNPDTICDTPNINRLAAEGLTFDEAYHMGSFSGAACAPSRHMVTIRIVCGTNPTTA